MSGTLPEKTNHFSCQELHTLTVAKSQDQEMMLINMNSSANEADHGDLTTGTTGAFGDLGVKKKQNLSQATYSVYDLYYDNGLAQKIARSSLFEHITLAVISLNAVYLGIDADYN